MKSALILALCAVAGVTVTPVVQPPSAADATSEMKRAAQCMLHVLKSVPGIDEIEMKYTDAGGWSHPFLQYRASPEPDGFRATMVFYATREFHSDDGMPFFMADLPGVFALNETGPPDYGAGKMAKRWEKSCRVHVMVLFN